MVSKIDMQICFLAKQHLSVSSQRSEARTPQLPCQVEMRLLGDPVAETFATLGNVQQRHFVAHLDEDEEAKIPAQ
jgi:hypothetical protein